MFLDFLPNFFCAIVIDPSIKMSLIGGIKNDAFRTVWRALLDEAVQ